MHMLEIKHKDQMKKMEKKKVAEKKMMIMKKDEKEAFKRKVFDNLSQQEQEKHVQYLDKIEMERQKERRMRHEKDIAMAYSRKKAEE